jgi:hypothetical protein
VNNLAFINSVYASWRYVFFLARWQFSEASSFK